MYIIKYRISGPTTTVHPLLLLATLLVCVVNLRVTVVFILVFILVDNCSWLLVSAGCVALLPSIVLLSSMVLSSSHTFSKELSAKRLIAARSRCTYTHGKTANYFITTLYTVPNSNSNSNFNRTPFKTPLKTRGKFN